MTTVAILGPGLIGGSLGMALLRAGGCRVLAAARTWESAAAAVRAGAAHEAAPLERAAGEADVVVLCMPLGAVVEVVAEVRRRARPHAVVTDVAGLKAPVHAAAEAAGPASAAFIGGHPMAGRERSGLENARADLFRGATWVLTAREPARAAGTPAGRRLEALVRAAGAAPLWATPEAHDAAAAVASHVPQALATAHMLAFAEGARERPLARILAAGGLRDTTRLAESPAGIWVDVLLGNAAQVCEGLERVIAELAALRDRIARGDAAALTAAFEAAAAARRQLAAEKGWDGA
ncbi:MAG: prephenate dehydrogenase/arogenate dehydrogenase family protein [Firmicutes bacterium]|nr:prephenate dehydrogenase/arogenate dehydrogenase family protein [Bacillota bacterium]